MTSALSPQEELSMNTTTVIRNASWIIAWNKERQAHVYLREADVAFCGDTIVFVGKDYAGQADTAQVATRNAATQFLPGFTTIGALVDS